jgi:hypothetical protein
MSKLLSDADFKRFHRELQHTPAGRRYRKAWHQMAVIHNQIRRLDTDFAAVTEYQSERRGLQLVYQAMSNEASACLEVLNRIYAWPEVAQVSPTWKYSPPPIIARQK